MNFRSIVLKIHRWLSIAAAIPLVLLGLSGAILTFENEIDRSLNPHLLTVAPHGTALAWQEVLGRVQQKYPKSRVVALRIPQRADLSVEASLTNGLHVYIDPYQGTVLGERRRAQIVAAYLHRFHTNLLVGEPGSKVQGVTALTLIALCLSGLVLWWRQKVMLLRANTPPGRWWHDLHSMLGIYAWPFWLVLGTTGAMMTFESVAEPLTNRLAGSVPTLPQFRSVPAAGREPLSIDRVVEIAQQRLTGALVTLVTLPASEAGTFTAFLKFPDDRTPAGRSRVVIDRTSGEVLGVLDTRDVPLGTWIWQHHRSWHTGDQWGWSSRLLMFAASLALLVQVLSGLVLWQRRRWRR